MSKIDIHKLPLGNCNCYLIKQEGLVLVDAGFANQKDNFRRRLEGLSIAPKDISLILLTHGHYDHIGSAADLRKLTGAKIAINYRERDWVEQALKRLPPGIGFPGKVVALMTRVMALMVEFPRCPVDLVLEDKAFSLRPFGIEGTVLYTPGHTWGSMSVLLDTGDAFVGDLAMSVMPLRFNSGMPSLGEDRNTVKESWRLLLDNGAGTIHPAHGHSFSADVLKKGLSG